MLDFLSEKIKKIILEIGCDNIYELRIRKDKNICVNKSGKYIEIPNTKTSQKDLESFFVSACSFSVYAHQKSINNGFITTENGERIGLCGEYIYEKGQIVSFKNITSMVVRIPHQIINASRFIQPLLDNCLKNLLIISPPGMGKTTILRDLALYCSDKLCKNIIVIDEKYELYSKNHAFNLGKFTDVLTGISKKDGLRFAVKNLKPDLIILDELSCKEEINGVTEAISSGVKVICSAHGEDLCDLKKEKVFDSVFINAIFDCYIILENIGKIKKIYKANGNDY